MESDEEMEFELEDEVHEEKPKKKTTERGTSKVRPKPNKGKKTEGKRNDEAHEEPTKKAKKMPISNGIKKRLVLNKREIERLKKELNNLKDDKEAFERELELLEGEFEKLRTEKERMENEVNHQIAVATALEKKQKRTQKDFENYKKRMETEIERKAKMQSKKLILGVIDLIDNFQRAISDAQKGYVSSEVKPLIAGMESIEKSMVKLLLDHGIQAIEPSEDDFFDPKIHEAVDTITDTTKVDNSIIKVDTKGYMFNGVVLRPSKVRVAVGGKPRPREKKEVSKEAEPEKEDSEEEMEEGAEVEDIEAEEIEEQDNEDKNEGKNREKNEEKRDLDDLMKELDKLGSGRSSRK